MSMADILFGNHGAKASESPEKRAASSDERIKYIKAAIVASIAAAGIGALVRSEKSRKDRKKSMDAEKSENAIVVPVKRSKFMEGLPTPSELAASRGESDSAQAPVALPGPSVSDAMGADDIAAIKREILRGRKVDFFGKRAADKEKDEEGRGKEVTEEKYDGRTVLRDQTGKFVSPTDPAAVEQVKEAQLVGIWDSIAHPIDSAERIGKAIVDKPIMFTAGALGSIYLAKKISDAINSIRRERAKERLDDARQRYVDLLESDNEKVAQEKGTDVRDLTGTMIGASFFVPLAITALVTNKIIENRRREKAKSKDMSDSYPDEPYILYKVSEDRSMKVSPEAMLTLLSIKRAMIEDAEAEEALRRSGECEKTAQFGKLLVNSLKRVGSALEGKNKTEVLAGLKRFGINFTDEEFNKYLNNATPFSDNDAYKAMIESMKDPRNNATLGNMVSGYLNRQAGGTYNFNNDAASFVNAMDPATRARFAANMIDKVKFSENGLDISDVQKSIQGMKDKISADPSMQKLLLERMDAPEYADVWNPIIEGQVNKYLTSKEGWGLDPNGFLFKVISWIANNTGLGKYFAKRHLNNMFYAARNPQQNASAGAQQAGSANVGAAPGADPSGAPGGQAGQANRPNGAHPAQPAPQNPPSPTGSPETSRSSAQSRGGAR